MTTSSALPPVVAERYETVRLLARGGMADVYLANDQVLHRPVAMKVLFDRFASDPIFVARFQREAKSAARLNHPNVVKVYDSGDDANTHYIVMEYVEGPTLAQKLAADKRFSVDDANDIASQVADALAVAHAGGMVHRDIKPSNILLTPGGRAKVTDFGIARAVGGGSDLTEAGKVIGTAAYFSPEQALGEPVDARSDLYSLGVVLFEIVTGSLPFSGPSDVAVAYKHVQETPPAASSLRPDIPPALDLILVRLLAKNPADRYATAVDLRADLDHLWNSEPLTAAPQATPGVPGPADRTVAMDIAPHSRAEANRSALQHNQSPSTAILGGLPEQHGNGTVPIRSRPAGGQPPIDDSRRSGFGGGWTIAAAAVLAAVVISLVVAIASSLNSDTGDDLAALGEPVKVPTLIGDLQATAVNRVREAGLEPNVRFEPNEDVNPGEVFDQDPAARAEVEPNTVVNIIVAASDDTVAVPNVVNKRLEEARDELLALEFKVNVEEQTSGDVEAGRVISQSIEAEQKANAGEQVTLIVSTGPEFRAVPQVTGQTQASADQQLREQGFIPRLVLVEPDPEGPDQTGLAIEQSPGPGVEAPVGSIVTIRVVRGRATTSTASTTTTTTQATTTTTKPTTTTTTKPTTTTTKPTTTTEPTTTTTKPTTTTTATTTTTTESSTTTEEEDPPSPTP